MDFFETDFSNFEKQGLAGLFRRVTYFEYVFKSSPDRLQGIDKAPKKD